MPLADVPAYVARVPCYRMMSDRFLGQPPESLAAWLVEDLQRVGAITIRDGIVRPTAAA
jgi:hypothetical protein